MSKKETRNNVSYYFDYAEEEDDYALRNYGVKVKNRAAKKPQKKFTEKRQK